MLAQITIEGVDGSTWHVHGTGSGAEGVHLGQSPQGLYDMPVRTLWAESAYRPGAIPNGVRFEPADLVLQFMLVPKPGQMWESVEAAFLRAFSYERDCLIGVQTEQSGLRLLAVRMLEAPKMQPDFDPHVDEYSEIILTLRAKDPFWWGPVESQTVTATGADGSASVRIVNTGDREIWPVWQKVGVGRWTIPDTLQAANPRRITMPTALTPVNYVVDVDPHVEQVSAPGYVGAWAAMGAVRFVHPILPGADFETTVSWTGAGTGAKLDLLTRTRFGRPWGGG